MDCSKPQCLISISALIPVRRYFQTDTGSLRQELPRCAGDRKPRRAKTMVTSAVFFLIGSPVCAFPLSPKVEAKATDMPKSCIPEPVTTQRRVEYCGLRKTSPCTSFQPATKTRGLGPWISGLACLFFGLLLCGHLDRVTESQLFRHMSPASRRSLIVRRDIPVQGSQEDHGNHARPETT